MKLKSYSVSNTRNNSLIKNNTYNDVSFWGKISLLYIKITQNDLEIYSLQSWQTLLLMGRIYMVIIIKEYLLYHICICVICIFK